MDNVEKAAINWQYHNGGDFHDALFKAISLADEENKEQLRLGFPVEVEAYERYANEPDWWQRIKIRWLDNQGSGYELT